MGMPVGRLSSLPAFSETLSRCLTWLQKVGAMGYSQYFLPLLDLGNNLFLPEEQSYGDSIPPTLAEGQLTSSETGVPLTLWRHGRKRDFKEPLLDVDLGLPRSDSHAAAHWRASPHLGEPHLVSSSQHCSPMHSGESYMLVPHCLAPTVFFFFLE